MTGAILHLHLRLHGMLSGNLVFLLRFTEKAGN